MDRFERYRVELTGSNTASCDELGVSVTCKKNGVIDVLARKMIAAGADCNRHMDIDRDGTAVFTTTRSVREWASRRLIENDDGTFVDREYRASDDNHQPRSPKRAIRAKCIDCSGGSLVDVRKCWADDCSLYDFRMGKKPPSPTRLKAIREYCLWCTMDQPEEIKLCPSIGCPLHPYRFGKLPENSRKISDEALEAMRVRANQNFSKINDKTGGFSTVADDLGEVLEDDHE